MKELDWQTSREFGSDKHFTCWGGFVAEIEDGETPIDFLFTVRDGRDKVVQGEVTDLALAKEICKCVIFDRASRNNRLSEQRLGTR